MIVGAMNMTIPMTAPQRSGIKVAFGTVAAITRPAGPKLEPNPEAMPTAVPIAFGVNSITLLIVTAYFENRTIIYHNII